MRGNPAGAGTRASTASRGKASAVSRASSPSKRQT
jgi:hypothetical protein